MFVLVTGMSALLLLAAGTAGTAGTAADTGVGAAPPATAVPPTTTHRYSGRTCGGRLGILPVVQRCTDGPEGGGRCSPRTFCDERGVRMPAVSPATTTLPAAAGAATELGAAAAAAEAGATAADTCARRLF